MKSEKAIVIGSGIGGIAVSIRLAIQGFDVHVYEANSMPGGKLSFFEKAGYQFDEGPSLFTQPKNIEELFILAGEPIEDYFTYRPVDMACTYFFENGKVIHAYTDKNKFSEELHHKLNEKKEATIEYLSNAEKLYHSVGTIFLNFSLHKVQTWLHTRIFKALAAVKFSYLFGTLYQHNKAAFKSKEAVQLFSRFATYNGSNPYKAPGMMSLIPHLEHNEGTYYPKGGMIQIVHALYQLATKKGVTFHFDHPVDKILQENKKVRGILTKGIEIQSSIVVSNGDVYFTYKNLLQHNKAIQLEKQERSSSALIFYWGIKNSFNELGLHNILFSEGYEEEFKNIFEKNKWTADPTIYINITSKMDASHAPSGGENWFVMINAPVNNHQDWDEYVANTRKMVIEKINRMLQTNIETFIETESIMNPAGIEKKTNTYKGSLYGTSSNSKWAAFFRPANFTSSIKGLYFCGGTVHPGGGIPLCLKSAYITATLIKKDYGK